MYWNTWEIYGPVLSSPARWFSQNSDPPQQPPKESNIQFYVHVQLHVLFKLLNKVNQYG